MYNGLFIPSVGGLLFALLLTVIGVAVLRRAFAAPWLGWLSLALAAVNVVSSVIYQTTTNGNLAVVSLLGTAGFGVVVLVTSIYMLRYRLVAVA